jgi:CRP-like cAMP-binding protein
MADRKKQSFLDSLSDTERSSLLERSEIRAFQSGEILIVEGSVGDSMFVIANGELDVSRGDLKLAHLSDGSVVGEMALLDPAPRSASVVASSSGKAYELERNTFMTMLDAGDPNALALLRLLTGTVCARLGRVNKMVQDEVVKPEPESGFKGLWKRIRSAL